MGAHENKGVLSDAQAIAADDTVSTNTIDLGQPNASRMGVGDHAPYLAYQGLECTPKVIQQVKQMCLYTSTAVCRHCRKHL